MKLTIGISPCPNDTFIFDAIYNRRIDTSGLEFEFIMEDVEYLNRAAFEGRLDVTKLSYFAFTQMTPMYQMMLSGGALGRNCGPLLVSNKAGYLPDKSARIAIPGRHTTANFLLSLAFPQLIHKEEVIFSSIEDQVTSGAFDAGLIIHESRFTYKDKGLHLVTDLGVFWEQRTGTPIPLGGIVIKRNMEEQVKQSVNQIIRESVQFAFDHPKASHEFVTANAQEMDEKVMAAHIALYVNELSLDLGAEGELGVQCLFSELKDMGLIQDYTRPLFIDRSQN